MPLLYCLLIIGLYFVCPLRLFCDIMKLWQGQFNIILALVAVAAFGSACKSTDKPPKKPFSIVRLHMERRPDTTDKVQPIQVFRAHPITLYAEKAPFLTEINVKSAEVVESVGGFSVAIQFNRQGAWLLEQYTSANRNQAVAVFAGFGGKDGDPPKVTRWIAAPRIAQRITDGKLVFTPDADREEADLLVLGLNNAAKKNKGIGPDE